MSDEMIETNPGNAGATSEALETSPEDDAEVESTLAQLKTVPEMPDINNYNPQSIKIVRKRWWVKADENGVQLDCNAEELGKVFNYILNEMIKNGGSYTRWMLRKMADEIKYRLR